MPQRLVFAVSFRNSTCRLRRFAGTGRRTSSWITSAFSSKQPADSAALKGGSCNASKSSMPMALFGVSSGTRHILSCHGLRPLRSSNRRMVSLPTVFTTFFLTTSAVITRTIQARHALQGICADHRDDALVCAFVESAFGSWAGLLLEPAGHLSGPAPTADMAHRLRLKPAEAGCDLRVFPMRKHWSKHSETQVFSFRESTQPPH